jgi:plastocyanin
MRTRTLVLAALTTAFAVVLPAAPAAAGGGGCHGATLTDDATTEVVMASACFTPTVARVGTGESVTFRNADPMVHAVTGAGGSFGDYADIPPGGSVTHTFDEAGVFPYFCVLHPSMVGAVVVGDAVQAAGAGGADLPRLALLGGAAALAVGALVLARRSIVRSRALSSAG